MKIAACISGLALVLAGWLFYQDMEKQLNMPLNIEGQEYFSIEPGMSLLAVAEGLAARGWFEYPFYLQLEGKIRGVDGLIKAGQYQVEPGATASSLLDTIVAGKVTQHALTIVEGWSFPQIMAALHDSRYIRRQLNSTRPDRVMAEIGYPGYHAEGRFFPDTYYFPAETTDVDFLRRSFKQMEAVLSQEWDRRMAGLPYRSPYEALIMASLIEKETAAADERNRIAGVFVRRLEKNMKLQTDPTVIYALGENYDGNIRRRDLEFDSPYNTYRYKGLPPTPIAAPGRASIHAALQPEPGTALFFVATGENGRHYFSDTLAEHNQAVARYQLR
ncbi:MAG: endolytic transglycosylase MltG [Gammaproteobacteria bacterium]|nr:endolytic transglycosylase MltG [Gammaproteobacteria bacterium]